MGNICGTPVREKNNEDTTYQANGVGAPPRKSNKQKVSLFERFVTHIIDRQRMVNQMIFQCPR